MPTYEVSIQVNATIVVDAESEDRAMEIATEVPDYGDFKCDEVEVLSTIPEDRKERLIAHADGHYNEKVNVKKGA